MDAAAIKARMEALRKAAAEGAQNQGPATAKPPAPAPVKAPVKAKPPAPVEPARPVEWAPMSAAETEGAPVFAGVRFNPAPEYAAFAPKKEDDLGFNLMLEEARRRDAHASQGSPTTGPDSGDQTWERRQRARHLAELTEKYAGGDLEAYLKRVDEKYPGTDARTQLMKTLKIDESDLPTRIMGAVPYVMTPLTLATTATLPAVDMSSPVNPAYFTPAAAKDREEKLVPLTEKIEAFDVGTKELADLNVGQPGGSPPNTLKITANVGAQNAAHQIMRVLASDGGEDELFKYVEPFSKNGDWLEAQREIAARFYPKVVARYPKLSKNAAEHTANMAALQYLAALRTTGSWTGPIYVSKAALEGGEFKRQYVPTPALDVEVVGVGARGNIILRAVPLAASIMQGVFGTIESAGIGAAKYADKKSDIEAERQKDSLHTRNMGGERIPLSTFDPNLLPIEAEHNTRAVKMDPILDKREDALSLKNEVASALAEQAALPTEAGRYAEAHQLGSWEALGLSGLAMIGSTIIPGPGEVAALARMGLVGEKNVQSLGRVGELLKKTQSPAVDVAIDALTSTPGIDRILVGESAPALRTLEGGVESSVKAADAYNAGDVAKAVTHLEAAELAEQKLRNANETREVPVLNAEGKEVGKKKVAIGTAPMVMEAVDRMEGELTTRFLNEQGGVRSEADLRAVNALSDTGVANALNRLDMIAKARGLEPWSQDVNLATAKRRMDNVKYSVRYGAAKDLRELENVKRALEAAPITDAERVANINDRVLRGSGVGEDVVQALNSFDYLKFMRADDVDSQAITVALFKHVADELGIGDNIADPRFEKFIAARDLITKNIVRESNLQKMLDDVPGLIDTAQRAVMMKRELRSTAAALVTRIARRTGGKIMSLGEAQALTEASPGLKLGVRDIEAAPKIDLKTGASSDGDKLSQLIGFFNRYQVPREERLSPGAARLLSKATAFFRGDVKAARINLALIDAVARNWSDATGRPSAEWWRTRIGDIRVADSRDVNVGDALRQGDDASAAQARKALNELIERKYAPKAVSEPTAQVAFRLWEKLNNILDTELHAEANYGTAKITQRELLERLDEAGVSGREEAAFGVLQGLPLHIPPNGGAPYYNLRELDNVLRSNYAFNSSDEIWGSLTDTPWRRSVVEISLPGTQGWRGNTFVTPQRGSPVVTGARVRASEVADRILPDTFEGRYHDYNDFNDDLLPQNFLLPVHGFVKSDADIADEAAAVVAYKKKHYHALRDEYPNPDDPPYYNGAQERAELQALEAAAADPYKKPALPINAKIIYEDNANNFEFRLTPVKTPRKVKDGLQLTDVELVHTPTGTRYPWPQVEGTFNREKALTSLFNDDFGDGNGVTLVTIPGMTANQQRRVSLLMLLKRSAEDTSGKFSLRLRDRATAEHAASVFKEYGAKAEVLSVSPKQQFVNVELPPEIIDVLHTRNPYLFQDKDKTSAPRGFIEFVEDNKAVITGLESRDPSTFIHEVGHLLRSDLSPRDMDALVTELRGKGIHVLHDNRGHFVPESAAKLVDEVDSAIAESLTEVEAEVQVKPELDAEALASIKDEAADAPERVEVEEIANEASSEATAQAPIKPESKPEIKVEAAAPKGFTTPTPDEVRVFKDQLRTRDNAKLRVDKTRAEMAPFADEESRATDVYAALVKRLKSEEEKLATAEANVTPGTQASVDYAAAAAKATEFGAEVKLLADKINDFAVKKIRLTPAQAKKLAKDITEARANLRDAEAKMAAAKSIIEQHPVPAAPKASNSLAAAQKELQAKAKTQAKTEAKSEVKAEATAEAEAQIPTFKSNKDALLATPRLKDVAQRRKAIAAAEEAVEKHKAGIEAVPAELHNTNAYKNAVAKLPELEAKLAAAQSVVSEKAHARYEYTRAVGAYNDALTAYKRAVKKGDAAEELVELQMSADAVQAANDAFMALPPTEPRATGVAKPAPMSLAAKAAAEAAKAADKAAEKAREKAAKDAEKATEKAAAKPEKSEKPEVTSKPSKPSASDEAAAEKAMKFANATAAKEAKAAEKAAKDAEKAAAKAEKVAAAKAAAEEKAAKAKPAKRVTLSDIMEGKPKAEPEVKVKPEVKVEPKPEPQAYVSPDVETWAGPVVERTRFRNVEPVAKTSAKAPVKAEVKVEAPKLTVEDTYVHDGLNSQNPAFNDEKVNIAIGNIKDKPPFKALTDAQKGEFTPYLYAIIDLVGGKTATQALERKGVRAADGVAAILEASAKDPKAEQDAASAKVARQRAVHALKELVSKKLSDMGADALPAEGYTSPKKTRFYQGDDAQTSAKPGIHPEVRRAEEAYADMVESAFKGEANDTSHVNENISAHLQSLGAALTREGKAIKVPVSLEVERMMEPFMRDEPTTGPFGRAKDTRTPDDNLLPTELTEEDLVNPVATHEKIKADIEHFKGLEHTQNESFAEEIAALETKRQLLLASPEHKAAVSAALQEKYDFIVQKEYPSENDLKLAARIKQRIASLAPKPELETRASTAANPETLPPELRAYAELNIPTTEKPLNLGTNNRAASVVEDTVHGGIYQSLAGSPVLTTGVGFMLGIGADEDHAFRAMPPEARRITMSAGVRPIQEYNADISRLVSEWARDPALEDSVFAYLNGEATRFGDDSPTLTSGGTNHTEWAIQQLQARWNAMTLEEQQKIEAYVQSCGRDKNGLIKPFSGPEEISDMTSAVGLINKILKRADYTDNTAAPGDAFINLARQSVWHAGSADDASTRPQIQAWFLSLLDAADVFEDSRVAAKETNPSRRLINALAAHTPDNIKAPHHAAVLLGTYGGMREVGDAFLSQSFGVTREDAQLYARWRQGLAIPADAMPRVTEMAKRYGLEADFTLVPELDVGALLLPRETRIRIQQELLHGRRLLSAEEKLGLQYGAKTKDVLSGEYKRNFIEGFAQRAVERTKNMMVFGNLFMRAPAYINDTQGLFEATGAAGGLATASRMAARRSSTLIFTNVPGFSQITDSINYLSKLASGPGSKVAKLMTRGRMALSKAADASINLFSALITFNSANRNNPRVVDILEGGTQIIETPNGPMTRNEVRAILRQEGVFATFERGQMAEALFNEGSSDGNAVSRAYGRVANSIRRHRYETNYAISVQTRVGNALAFMEMGYDPRTAGRLALMTAYDYVNTSSGWDKHVIYNIFFPFQSFRKNNSRFILNRIASYNGIRKLSMATRLVGTFPQTMANFLEAMDRDEGDRYGVDEGALSLEARNEFNRFALIFEEGYAPLYGANPEKWPDIVKRNLAGTQDFAEYYAGLNAEEQEFLSFGYGGYENVPTSVKAFVNEYVNGYQRDVMAGSVMERKIIEGQEHGNIDSYAPMDWRSATTKQRFGDTSRFQYEYMLNRPSATIRPRPGTNVNDYVRDRDAQRVRSSKGSGTDSLNAYTMNMTETNTAAYATWLGCSLTLMAGAANVAQVGGEHIFDADPADIEAWHNDLKNGSEYSIEPSRTSDFYGFTEFVRTNKDAINACSDPERAILLGNFVRMAGGEDSAVTINPALYGLIDAASLPLPLDKTVVGGQERRTMSPAAKALMEITPPGMIFLEANDFANRTMPVVNALSGKTESMLSAQVMDAQERGETLSPAFILSAAKAAGFNVSEVVPSSVMYREGPEFTKKTTTPE